MRKFFIKSIFLFLLSGCTAIAASPEHQQNTANESQVSILASPGLSAFKRTLSQIVKERSSSPGKSQHFYIAKFDKDENRTYMFWLEEKQLWIMTPGGPDEESWLGVRYPSSGALLDLKNDVVESTDEVGTSTYLVTKDWAAGRLFDAVVNGDLIIVNK